MKVVADSGPLIAFAKIGGLGTLFDLYPEVLTPRAVHEETVHKGNYLNAPDAALLRAEYDTGRLRVERIQGTVPAGIQQLGKGEQQCIQAGGNAWESNPPPIPIPAPDNGFEDRERHQPLSASAALS